MEDRKEFLDFLRERKKDMRFDSEANWENRRNIPAGFRRQGLVITKKQKNIFAK